MHVEGKEAVPETETRQFKNSKVLFRWQADANFFDTFILKYDKWKWNFPVSRGSPTLVQALPGPSVQVTAGSNHTAVLLMDGQVFTFGSFSVRVLAKNDSFWTSPLVSCPHWSTNCSECLSPHRPPRIRKDSWAVPSSTCPTGTPSRLPCPTSAPSTDGRRPGSARAATRRSCASTRPSSTRMCSPRRRSSPASTSSAWCPPSCRSRRRSNACWSTKWTEAAGPSTTPSRRTCRALACVWIPCTMSYGGQSKTLKPKCGFAVCILGVGIASCLAIQFDSNSEGYDSINCDLSRFRYMCIYIIIFYFFSPSLCD